MVHESVTIHLNGIVMIQLVKTQNGLLTQEVQRGFAEFFLSQCLAYDFTFILIHSGGHFPG